jgi:hypothetical protein
LAKEATMEVPSKTVENWGLARVRGVTYATSHAVAGMCVVHGRGGQSTPIVGFDPATRTVRTKSGSVYALGVPNLMFAITNPETMRELGF